MSHIQLPDSSFYLFLLSNDKDAAFKVKAEGCCFCGGQLDFATYQRKPRHTPTDLPENFNTVFSLCCRQEGCRKRTPPPSLRFFGRRVYLLFILIKACSDGGRSPEGLIFKNALAWGVSRQALRSWYKFWRVTFSNSGFWRVSKGILPTSFGEISIPELLLKSFGCGSYLDEPWRKLLQFLCAYNH
jgi:hypothetical protein